MSHQHVARRNAFLKRQYIHTEEEIRRILGAAERRYKHWIQTVRTNRKRDTRERLALYAIEYARTLH